MTTKAQLIEALRVFVAQRPGLHSCDYSSAVAWRKILREVAQDRRDAERFLMELERHEDISAADILAAASSGRVKFECSEDGPPRIRYQTGSYFAVEFRRAVSRLCSNVLWDHMRLKLRTDGDKLRAAFVKIYRARLASRYFN